MHFRQVRIGIPDRCHDIREFSIRFKDDEPLFPGPRPPSHQFHYEKTGKARETDSKRQTHARQPVRFLADFMSNFPVLKRWRSLPIYHPISGPLSGFMVTIGHLCWI